MAHPSLSAVQYMYVTEVRSNMHVRKRAGK